MCFTCVFDEIFRLIGPVDVEEPGEAELFADDDDDEPADDAGDKGGDDATAEARV